MVVSRDSSKVSAGKIPGKRRASMVFPYPEGIGQADALDAFPPDVAEIIEIREPRAETGSQWAARLQDKEPLCACGCGERIRLKPQHRAPTKGIPRFPPGHHPNPLCRLYAAVRAKRLLLTGDICRRLSISESQYHRLEKGGVFPAPNRWGKPPRPQMRVFVPELVGVLRTALRSFRRKR